MNSQQMQIIVQFFFFFLVFIYFLLSKNSYCSPQQRNSNTVLHKCFGIPDRRVLICTLSLCLFLSLSLFLSLTHRHTHTLFLATPTHTPPVGNTVVFIKTRRQPQKWQLGKAEMIIDYLIELFICKSLRNQSS